jgi:hypothetical protein
MRRGHHVGRKRTQNRSSKAVFARPRLGVACPIQVSTPPVQIIGTGRRHKGGFRLSDR